MKTKRFLSLLLSVILILSLVPTLTIAAAQGPTKTQDDIIASDSWEKVATKEGSVFIEGICINSQGDVWFVDVAFGAIYHVAADGRVETKYSNADGDTQIMPNGAKFVSDTQILITDRFIGLALFDTETCEFTTLLDKDPDGNAFLGLNDLVVTDNGDGTVTVFFTDSGSKSYYTDTYPQKGNVYTCVVDPEAKTATDFELVAKGIAYPNGVTIDPTGTYLYVTEFAENQVLSVPTDMSGREGIRIFARLYGGIGPDGVECDQNGYVYAAHLEAGEVVVLDTKGYEVCKIGVPEGFKVDNVCIYDGYLYCCEADKGTIWRIEVTDFVDSEDVTDVTCDGAVETSADYKVKEQGPTKTIDDIIASDSWEKVATKEGSVFIEGICINSQGDVWFVDVAFGAIYHVAADGTVETKYSNAEGDTQIMPNGAKFVSDTQILITDRFIGLALFDTETCEFTTLLDKDPDGNAFLGLNDLVVKDNGDGTVTVFFTDSGSKSYYTDTYPQKGNVYTCVVDPEAKTATDFELVAKGIAYPNGVTIDPTGTYLFVTEFAENQVLSVPTNMEGREGIRIFARLYGGIGPDGVECDQNGYVYCAHLEAGEVVVLDTKGYEVCKLGVPEGFKVDNVCIYDGYLYCCEADKGTIWRIAVTDFVDSEDVTDVTCDGAVETSADYKVKEQGPTKTQDDIIASDSWEKVATKEGSVFIEGICINSQGDVWFVDVAFGAIYHVAADGTVETKYSNAEGDTQIMPNGAKFVSDTQILITDRFIGLALFDTETCEFTTLLDKDPDGKAFLGLNDLVVKDNGDGTVTVFFTDSGSKSYYTDTYPQKGNVYTCVVDPEAKTATDFELVAKGIAYLNGVTIDPTGTYLYVTEFAENQVLSVPTDMSGREGIRIFARLYGGIGPDGVECDQNGYVYAAHLEAGEVVVLDTKGYEVCKIGVPEGFKVDNVCIYDGYLYCCEADKGTIWRIEVTDFVDSSVYGTCGDNLTWTLDSNGLLTISGTGDMDDYDSGSDPWYKHGAQIKKVVISDGVNSIGDNAFSDCYNLTSVTIPASVTSIGAWAFEDCSGLTSVTIGNGVTAIGEGAFWGCTSLTNVYYGGSKEQWNTIVISDNNDLLTNAAIHYNSGDDVVTGDVDGNGSVNNTDRLILARYLTGVPGYAERVDMAAADIDGNGRVNNIDRLILARYLAGVEGYAGFFQ